MDNERLVNRDLIWAPGADKITAAQMNAIRTRDTTAIRPIPSRTALGYDHLMADADRTALLAEVDRLNNALAAAQQFHHPHERSTMTSPYDLHLKYLRDRLRTVKGNHDLTRSARTAAITELVDAAVNFIAGFKLMHLVQEPPTSGPRHREATEEEIRERVAACIDGISIDRFVADMVDSGIDEEEAGAAAFDVGYGDMELWGMTFAEAIAVAASLGVPYVPLLAKE